MSMDVTKVNPLVLPSVSLDDLESLPSLSGIYFVIVDSTKVLYVGRSVNMYQRWKYHDRLSEFKSYDNIKVAWLPCIVQSEEDLDEIEKTYILQFNPALNSRLKKRERLRQTVYLYPDVLRWIKHRIAETDEEISDVGNYTAELCMWMEEKHPEIIARFERQRKQQ